VSDLDTLARAATRELLDRSTPDVTSRYGELKSIRTRRRTATLAAAAAAVVLGVGGWQLALDRDQQIQPAPPTTGLHNGALLGIHDFASDGAEGWGTAYGDVNEHLPTDADTEPLMQFSPDGRTLYYSDDQDQLATFDLATGTKQVLMPCPERGCLGGSISPDGRTGLFLGDGHLVVADLATGRTRSQTVPVADAGPMAWSPNGGRLAFLSSGGLWTMYPDGSVPTLVHQPSTVSSLPPYSVAWSPDGSRIAFFDVSQVAQGDATEQYTLMIVGAEGKHPVRVHEAGCCASDQVAPPSVAWSPDGSLLAVATSDLGGATGVYTVRPDGSQWTLRMKGYWSWLTWRPVAD
jgi:Tol biopolymer transport system component